MKICICQSVAASLPLLFVDGAKLHGLNFWYAFFPGAAGYILLCLICKFLALFDPLILHRIAMTLLEKEHRKIQTCYKIFFSSVCSSQQ